MPFLDTNKALGLPAKSKFQAGSSDLDNDGIGAVEQGFLLPWPSEPEAGWVYYDCAVAVVLDSGIVVHNRLPQVNNLPDTLGACLFDDPKLASLGSVNANGVNIKSLDQYTDIVQRMGHSRYWFRLFGQALRVGFQVPIPSIKTIGGVPAIPYDAKPQFAFNRIAPGGNYGGVILWHAAWSLWYTTLTPPRSNAIPAADPSAHISNKSVPPAGMQAAYTQPDDNAEKSAPNVQLFQQVGNNARVVP